MFSLIIAIVSIALIVALVALSGYFGGASITDAQAKTQAVRLISEERQILASMDMFQADLKRWPTSLDELVNTGYLRSIPAGTTMPETQASSYSFDLLSSAHAADAAVSGWGMPASGAPVIHTLKVAKVVCQAYNLAERGDDGILRQAFEVLPAQCYGVDGDYRVVVRKSTANITLAGVLSSSVADGNLPSKAMDDWWASAPTGAVKVPTDPEKTPKPELALSGATPLFFGQVQIGQSSTSSTLVLSNRAKVAAEGLSIQTPAGYSLVDSNCGAQLGAGASCSFSVGFTPVAVQNYAGVVKAAASTGSAVQASVAGDGVAGAAALSPVVAFGDVAAGQQLAKGALLSNTGVGPIRLSNVAVSGPGFVLSQNNCGAVLPAGASCNIQVTLTAAGVTAHAGSLLVTSPDVGGLYADLSGQSRQSNLTVSPTTVSFSDVQTSTTATGNVHTVTNTGNVATVAAVALTPVAPYTVVNSTCTAPLAAGATCSFKVAFTPLLEQAYNSKALDITGATGLAAQVTATGAGAIPRGTLTAELDFGLVSPAATKDMQSTLTNTGKVALTLSAPVVGTGTGFTLVNTDCAATLAPAATCLVTVRYTGNGNPASTGLLTVTAGGTAYTSALKGSSSTPITYTIGSAGTAGAAAGNGGAGGTTSFTYQGITVTAPGGAGGLYNTGAGSAGGVGSAGNGTGYVNGGQGLGASGDIGGGGGGGIGGGTAPSRAASNYGGNGGTPVDVSGLKAAVLAAGQAWGVAGLGPTTTAGTDNQPGSAGSGIGAGGGGGAYHGGLGGAGSFGGGGGGSSTSAMAKAGSIGGTGVLVVLFTDNTAVILTSGTSYAPTKAVKTVYAIGGGGGGAGVSATHSTSGGGGGAGAVVYRTFP